MGRCANWVLNLRTGRCEPAEGVPVRLGAYRFIAELAWAGVVALSKRGAAAGGLHPDGHRARTGNVHRLGGVVTVR